MSGMGGELLGWGMWDVDMGRLNIKRSINKRGLWVGGGGNKWRADKRVKFHFRYNY